VRWLLDEMLPRTIAQRLSELGHDAVPILDVKNSHAPLEPVDFVRKCNFSNGGGLATHLAKLLDTWARDNRDPYVGAD
jgi:hypothetical protein